MNIINTGMQKINPFKDFTVTKHTPVDFIILTDPYGLYNAHNYNQMIHNQPLAQGALKDPEVSQALMIDKTNPYFHPGALDHSRGNTNSLHLRTLGAYKVAHECRLRGYSVQVVDYQSFYDLETLKRIAEKYVGENTLAIGISVSFYMRYPWMLNMVTKEMPVLPLEGIQDEDDIFEDPFKIYSGFLAHGREIDDAFVKHVRSINPNVKFVKGGTRAREDVTMRNVDYVNVGWGDVTMPDMLDDIKNNTADSMPIHTTHPYKIDLLSKIEMQHSTMRYAKSDILFPGEVIALETARGCIFKCSFCSLELVGKEKGTYFKSNESIASEFIHNYEKHGVTDYWFVEDTFNDDPDKIINLHKIITSLPFKITFSCYLRLDLLYVHRNKDVPQHQLLLEMGLKRVEFGIETTNPESAKDVGKGLSPLIQLDFLRDLKSNHGWDNVLVGSGFILGLPSDTVESIQEMLNIMSKPDFPIDRPTLRALLIRPHDESDKEIEERGLSEFSKNWKAHGYSMAAVPGEYPEDKFHNWTNRHGVTYAMCEKMIGNYFKRKGFKPYKTKRAHQMSMKVLSTIGVAELVAHGLHWPTIDPDTKFDYLEYDQSNTEHTKKLSKVSAKRFLKYTELLLTQDLDYED